MEALAPRAGACTECGAAVGPPQLACPRCHRLVHADTLKELAQTAERATNERNHAQALAAWRTALVLLPPRSKQHDQVVAKLQTLSRAVSEGVASERAPATTDSKGKKTKPLAAGATGLALLLWKFKLAIAFVLTKGKLLLLGFSKLSTVLSMAVSLGVYAVAFGWKYAAGLLLSLYVHEMGHVASLNKYGIKASAPMFVPGFGAFVRLKQYPANNVEDARVGLAGPIYGLGAALFAAALAAVTGSPMLFAIAKTGAWINLFNLVPIWQLDGGRAFRALSRKQRWAAVGALAAVWFASGESVLVLLLLGAAFRALEKNAPVEGDRQTLLTYAGVVAVLAALCAIVVTV
ncbi:MAG: Zn-dependent protease [Labilithrix sp.]|nr:Zn-dependent protease [Labilithrix sp.]